MDTASIRLLATILAAGIPAIGANIAVVRRREAQAGSNSLWPITNGTMPNYLQKMTLGVQHLKEIGSQQRGLQRDRSWLTYSFLSTSGHQ